MTPNVNTAAPAKAQMDEFLQLYRDGKLAQAQEFGSLLARSFPQAAAVHNLLGAVHHGLGLLDLAATSFVKAIALQPDLATAHNNLGAVLLGQAKYEAATSSFERALALRPDMAQALENLGKALHHLRRFDEAVACLRKAITLAPGFAQAYCSLGNSLLALGRDEEAMQAVAAARDLAPEDEATLVALGIVLQALGKFEDARNLDADILQRNPDHVVAHYGLAMRKTFTRNDPQIAAIKRLLSRGRLSDIDQCRLHMALFKAHDDLNEPETAFRHLRQCNALRKRLLGYDIAQSLAEYRNLKRHFVKGRVPPAVRDDAAPRPIFVVGMPRSGTTLTEQIISSHPQVQGGGELSLLALLLAPLLQSKAKYTAAAAAQVRADYLAHISLLANDKPWITDKTTLDFRFIGYILEIFPEAKIVHTCRSPAAVCWSNLTHLYGADSCGFSYDANDVVEYHHLYRGMMAFWEEHFPGQVYHLDYERLTEDQEAETRKLIDYLGIGWDDACLNFHDNARSVRTASQEQVRKKMYTGSSGRWRLYEPLLEGAFESLPEKLIFQR